jgi:hypothetical protein
MKRFLLLVLVGLSMSAIGPQGATYAIVAAFKTADAQKIGAFFDDYVDMKLLDKDEVKSIGRNQATLALKAFLSENSIKGFEKLSQRELGTTMYLTGKLLNSDKGNNITIMMKLKDGRHQIITLRIS